MSAEPDGATFTFVGFTLDSIQRQLFGVDGEPVKLTARAFNILLFMIERPGILLDKKTLMKAIWPDTIVEENNLSQHILLVRRALGEVPGENRFIVTEPGRGFRFVAPVRRINAILMPDAPAESQRDESPRAAPSIAVLPFADMSPNQDQAYFADGLSEELSDYLSRLPDLRVVGRTSAFSFKGKNEDLRTIARALGVKHLLEGSVRKNGDQLRITAQLVDANGTRVWSNVYDQKLGDVFTIQDEVAKSVALALSVKLSASDMDLVRGGTRNIEAYDAYLLGRALTYGQPDEIRRGIEQMERAVTLDPNFALAWSRVGLTYLGAFVLPERGGEDWNAKAFHAASRALELAPELPSVQATAAWISMQRRDWTEAERRLQKARDLVTGSEHVWEQSGWFCFNVGRPREAAQYFRRAYLAAPLTAAFPMLLAATYEMCGDLDEADAELARGARLFGLQPAMLLQAMTRHDRARIETLVSTMPMDPIAHLVRSHLDEPQAALAELRRLADDPAFSKSLFSLSVLSLWAAYFGDAELSLQLLGKVRSDAVSAWMLWRRLLTDMRRLPGFKDLVRDLGLVDYWRASGNWGEFCRPLGDDDFECT